MTKRILGCFSFRGNERSVPMTVPLTKKDLNMDNNNVLVSIDSLMDKQEVMQRLHISERKLQTLRSNGTLPYTRLGGKIYYLREDIEAVLRNNYVMYRLRAWGKEECHE